MDAQPPTRRRIGVNDVRLLLRLFMLDRHIRRSSSGETTTSLVFEQVAQAERDAALIAEAWGAEKVVYVPGEHHTLVQVLRDIERYGTWPTGWRRHPLDPPLPAPGRAR